jgi:hypothetical protein
LAQQEPELGFEGNQKATGVRGWYEQPSGIAFADSEIVHSGAYSARIEGKPGATVVIMRILPIDFEATYMEIRAWVRTEKLTGWIRLWAREDGQLTSLASSSSGPVNGTAPWTEISLRLPIHAAGHAVSYGVFVEGAGKAWVDDIRFFADGKPLTEVKKGRGIDFDTLKTLPPN